MTEYRGEPEDPDNTGEPQDPDSILSIIMRFFGT